MHVSVPSGAYEQLKAVQARMNKLKQVLRQKQRLCKVRENCEGKERSSSDSRAGKEKARKTIKTIVTNHANEMTLKMLIALDESVSVKMNC